MCINTDVYPRRNSMSNGPVSKKRFPRRHSMTSSRPPRPSKSFNHTMAAMMIDTYEVDRVHEIMSTSQRRLRTKSVSFDEVVMVRPVLPLAEYTDQEIISSWYLPIEKQRMRAEIMNIIKVVKKKNETSEKQFNVRGLEWLAEKDKTRERKRKASIKEILNEQKAQRDAQANQQQQRDDQSSSITYDDKQFRKVYRRHSRAAMQLAQTMGKIDEMEGGNVEPAVTNMMMMGNNSCSSFNSCGSRSTRSTRSTSSRSSHSVSQRSISTKGVKSSRTRRGARRFSLGSSGSSGAPNEEFVISIP